MKIRDFTTMNLNTNDKNVRLQMFFNTDKPALDETELKEFIDKIQVYYNLLRFHNQQKRFQSE